MGSRQVTLTLALVWAVGACTFHDDLGANREIACDGKVDCPTGYTCRTAIGRCVPVADLDKPQVVVSAAALSPAAGNAQTSFGLDFQVSAALARTPRAFAVPFGVGQGQTVQTLEFTCGACAPGAACHCTYQADATQPPEERLYQVYIEVLDTAGNAPPDTSAGSFLYDATPPSLGHVSVDLTAASGIDTPIQALAVGSSAEVCFTASESLGQTPVVFGAPPAQPDAPPQEPLLHLEAGYPLGDRYCFSYALVAGVADGPRRLVADLVDTAGNAVRLPVANLGSDPQTLVLDATPPAAPDLTEAAGLRYRRAPWGEAPAIGTPSFSIRSIGNAFVEPGILKLYGDAQRKIELGRFEVQAGALEPKPLPGPDYPHLYVDFIDGAGNLAPGGPFAVKAVDFVASLGLKDKGDVGLNPNFCTARPVTDHQLFQPDDALHELDGATGPTGAGDARPIVSAARWRQRTPGAPDFDYATGFAYDSARGEVVLAGESVTLPGADVLGDLDWRYVTSGATSAWPGDRYGPALAYDAARGRTVLFGGSPDSVDPVCDTWTWDGASWRQVASCSVGRLPDGGSGAIGGPEARAFTSMAYDPHRQRVVLAGGEVGFFDQATDLWEWDGQAWTELPNLGDDGGPGFSGRESAGMTYRSFVDGGGQLVLMGGTVKTGEFDSNPGNDLWFGSWDGATYRWHQAAGGLSCGEREPGCDPHLAASPDGTLVAATSIANYKVEWWTWSDAQNAWQKGTELPSNKLCGLVEAPGPDGAPGLKLFASDDDFSGNTVTYSCDFGFHCQAAHISTDIPSARADHGLAFDPTGHALLVGGLPYTLNFDGMLDETWTWDGNDWKKLGNGFGKRGEGALVYQPDAHQFWWLGGHDATFDSNQHSDLWAFPDPSSGPITGGAWSRLANDSVSGGLVYFSMAYVPDGGTDGGGAMWNVSDSPDDPTERPALRNDPAQGNALQSVGGDAPVGSIAYDARRGVLVEIDENDGDVYEYDPATSRWVRRATSGPTSSVAVWDASAQKVLFIGGEDPVTSVGGDVWSWDGTTFESVSIADPQQRGVPSQRGNTPMAFDPVRKSVLLFGGFDHNISEPLRDTWELAVSPNQPAEVCRFPLSARRAAPGSQVRGIRVSAVAEAQQRQGTRATPADVALQVWRNGTWSEVSRCVSNGTACGPSAPGTLEFQAQDAFALEGLLADLNLVGVAVTPGSPNGSGFGEVGVRSLQVVITYVEP